MCDKFRSFRRSIATFRGLVRQKMRQTQVASTAEIFTCLKDFIYSICCEAIYVCRSLLAIQDRNAAEALKPPKAEQTSRRTLSAQETAAVLEVIDTHPDAARDPLLYGPASRRSAGVTLVGHRLYETSTAGRARY